MNASCRAFLREILGGASSKEPAIAAHLASCSFCAERARARAAFEPALRARPKLHCDSEELLADVYARVTDRAERSSLGRLLEDSMPVTMPSGGHELADAGWPEKLLESETSRVMVEAPRPPSRAVWTRVRTRILARLTADAVATVRRRWMMGAAGAAAVAVVLFVTSRNEREVPNIVFRELSAGELASLGSFEFVVVRHGATR